MADVTKNASVNIKANVESGNMEVFRGQLESLAVAGKKSGEGVSQGMAKAAGSTKVLENQLYRLAANMMTSGSSVEAAIQKFQFKHPNVDLAPLQNLIATLRQIEAEEKRAQESARETAATLAAEGREYKNLAKQIETAMVKAQQGMSASSADYFKGLASARNIQFQPQEQANLAALENAQRIQQQNLAAAKQTAALSQRIAVEERGIQAGLQRAIDGFATANMTASERFRYQIQQMGLDIQKFLPQIQQLELAEQKAARAAAGINQMNGALTKGGLSIAQYNAAVRGLPAQFTDIVVSLQGGQRPLTVLLQQGGQIKDMFGGVGEALKATATEALKLVNPFTVLATVAATVGYAMYQGAKDQTDLQNALVRSGNYAGATGAQLMELADSVGKTTGKFSDAKQAVEALAASGKMSFEEITSAAQALVDGATVSGEKIEKLATSLEAVSTDPVEGIFKLNEGMNFLTKSVYDQIVALQKAGKTHEAAQMALEAYAQAMRVRSAEVVANAGWIERSWWAVRDAIASAWAVLKSFGRDNSVANAAQIVENFRAGGGGEDYRNNANYKAAMGVLVANKAIEQSKKRQGDAMRAEHAQIVKAHSAYKDYMKSRNKKPKKAKTGGVKTNPEVSEYENITKTIQQRTEAIRLELQYGDKLTEAEKLRIQIENNSVNSKKKLTEAHKQALQAKVAELRALEKQKYMADYEKKWEENTRKFNRAFADKVAVIGMGEKEAALYKKQMDVMHTAEEKYLEAQRKGIDDGTAQKILDDAAERIKLMAEQKSLLEQEFNDPWKALTESIRTYREEAVDTGKQLRDAFSNAFSSMEDAFVQFVTTGKLSFSGLVNSILQDIARMMARKAVSNLLEGILSIGGNALSNWLGGGNVAGAGGSQVKDSLSDFSYRGSGVSFRAAGGPVYGGSPYVVGERGPELFVPAQSGKIVSNDDLMGRNGLGAGGFNIQISHRNEGVQQQVTDSGADFDGKNLIIRIVTQDIANDGMISRTMSRTFGMRRAAGAM